MPRWRMTGMVSERGRPAQRPAEAGACDIVQTQRGETPVFKIFNRRAVAAAILLVPIGLAACGESSEEKATAQVCSSTKEIRAQLSTLSSLSISSRAPEEIKTATEVMKKEAAKIDESVGDLPASSKSSVETAQKALQAELAALAKTVASTAKSSGNVEAVLHESAPGLKTAVAGLGASYKTAYESLKCS